MAAFEYRQAQEIRDVCARRRSAISFIGKSGAILLGFPDTTQDADLFVEKSPANCRALVAALIELGFALRPNRPADIERGKDFVQLKNGPFDLDLDLSLPTASSGSRRLGTGGWRSRVPGLPSG